MSSRQAAGHPAAPDLRDALGALEAHFGYKSFRPGQSEVIEAVLTGRDALAVMPTGAGKSVCYQIPAVLFDGLVLVVSPLISLMTDQVRSLREAGIRGSYLNSTLTPRQQEVVMARALTGWYDVMYVAPERLVDRRFRDFVRRACVPLVAVDEAHCVSQWGQDFRPAYRGIADFVSSLDRRPAVVALTATATRQVREDIVSLLDLRDPLIQVNGFDRPNLKLLSFELTPKKRQRWLESYICAHPSWSGIVYTTTRRRADDLADALRQAGVSAASYHAGHDAADRDEAQRRFLADEVRVMVATNAFGMGIDKPDVRFVINWGLPLSLEEYYQEAGRAGRDGESAECCLLWSRGDIRTCHYLIDNATYVDDIDVGTVRRLSANRERLLGEMIGYAMSDSCLHRRILRYFGQDVAEGETHCEACSVCLGETAEGHLRSSRPPATFGRTGSAVAGTAAARRMRQDDEGELLDDEELFQRLRHLRRDLADEAGVPPYVVFSDATLRAMVRRRPATPEELLQISGVGKVKLARYGQEFLDVLSSGS